MKQCKECKELKPRTEFYGIQGECKTCTKKRVRLREQKLRLDPNWMDKERERNRKKYHRLGYKEKHKPSPEKKIEMLRRYRAKYPEKYKAKCASQRLSILVKGNHLHHWSYNKIHWKDIIEINETDHNIIHRFLKYDQKTFYYKDLNGNLLDTKDKHLFYINKVLEAVK